MARFTRRIEVPTPPEETFAYVADFSTTSAWDPGISDARRLDDGPLGEGCRFEVVSTFGGRQIPVTYTITSIRPSERVVLEGIGDRFRGVDDIRFSPAEGGGTRVQYVADLRLRGIARIAEPFMRSRFEQVVEDGARGLERTLRARGTS
ncbi:MAG TPA: SRPBCC family protein [Actinomycetota bacterium]|nr:SRPBCC family protein [Actinomycetota bacterium]